MLENRGFITFVENQDEKMWIFQVDQVFFPLIGFEFIVPLVIRIVEAWSNAHMLLLFKQLKKQSSQISTEEDQGSKERKQKADKKQKKKRKSKKVDRKDS